MGAEVLVAQLTSSFAELSKRQIFYCARVSFIVMLEPGFRRSHNSLRVRPIFQTSIVTRAGIDKALSHFVALQAFDRHGNRLKTKRRGKATRIRTGRAMQTIRDISARHTKSRADLSHCSPPDNKGDRAINFRLLPHSTTSLRISFSSVVRPKAASSRRICFIASCISDAGMIDSLAPISTSDPSNTSFTPIRRVTKETDFPGYRVCWTEADFSPELQRRRRCTAVKTSTQSELFNKLVVVNIGVFLVVSLRNTSGSVNHRGNFTHN